MARSIRENVVWDDYAIGSAMLEIPMLGKMANFEFFKDDEPRRIITPEMEAAVHDVQALSGSDLDVLKDLLWEEFVFSFVVADYGIAVRPDETAFDAHKRDFAVVNREDAWARCRLERVQITAQADDAQCRIAKLCVDTVTDNYINVIVRDGRIVDFDDDGTYLGQFADDATAAQKRRWAIMIREFSEAGLKTILDEGRA